MTKEEARKTIDDILACFGDKSDGAYELTQLDAEDMREAIRTLSAEPCEDAISMSVVEDIKAEIRYYRDAFILGNRHDLAAVAENCLMFIDKHISGKESE